MSNCSANIELKGAYDLGCFSHCSEVKLPMLACQTGIHTFVFKNKGRVFTNRIFAEVNTRFEINTSLFNECAPVELEIINPDESYYSDIDCNQRFYFEVKIIYHATNVPFHISGEKNKVVFENGSSILDCEKCETFEPTVSEIEDIDICVTCGYVDYPIQLTEIEALESYELISLSITNNIKGGSIEIEKGNIKYTPEIENGNDLISYEVYDLKGNKATGNINVEVVCAGVGTKVSITPCNIPYSVIN